MCAALMFALLANVTIVQAFGSHGLNSDARNERSVIARFDRPRGDILTYDGTTIATSRESGAAPYAYRRHYAGGEAYAAVTGQASLYRNTGIEQAEDDVLSGHDPRVRVRSIVRHGRAPGADVRLTITDRVQRAAYQGLRSAGHPGAAVAVNPATGAILAMASYPSYDPDARTTTDPAALDALDRRLADDPAEPLVNRAIGRTYPPGAAFTLVTAAAALSSGEYAPASRVAAPARLRLPGDAGDLPSPGGRCGDGRPTLPEAFRGSCDTAFAGIGLQLGQDVLRDQAEAFGFNDAGLAVPLPVARSTFPAGMDRARTALSAIGRHLDRVTPLMLAMLSAAVANQGVLMRPYLVEEVRLPDGSLIDRADPVRYRVAMTPEPARALTSMMTPVAATGGPGMSAALPDTSSALPGTAVLPGSSAALPGLWVAAGSGPAALFTAFAPAGSPEVAVGVVLEHAPPSAAAPIARSVVEAALA